MSVRPPFLAPLPDPADPSRLWHAALLRCPYCGALLLQADVQEHGDAHRKHDREHDGDAAAGV